MSEHFNKVYSFTWNCIGAFDVNALANGRDMSHALEVAAKAVACRMDGELDMSGDWRDYMNPDSAGRAHGLSGPLHLAQCFQVHVSSNY